MKITRAFTIDKDLWKRFKKYCIDKDTSISSELGRIIEEVLTNE